MQRVFMSITKRGQIVVFGLTTESDSSGKPQKSCFLNVSAIKREGGGGKGLGLRKKKIFGGVFFFFWWWGG